MSDVDQGPGPGGSNRTVREIWDQKAAYWDERFGEGNDFHRTVVEPAADRLLGIREGERVLDVACGNGAYSRHLAALGARVLAVDFSASFLELARRRTTEQAEQADRIEYRLVDAADLDALLALGHHAFDAVVANMALMDMADIEPLARAITQLLTPSGRLVFTVLHPCFNSLGTAITAALEDHDGELVVRKGVSVERYLRVPPGRGCGMPGEPVPHYYFQRPLCQLLGVFFRAGLVLDGLEEPAFSGEGRPLNWDGLSQIPPVLAARLRPASLTG